MIYNMNELKSYLDMAIRNWRQFKEEGKYDEHTCACYIDAFQSVRVSVFGGALPKED